MTSLLTPKARRPISNVGRSRGRERLKSVVVLFTLAFAVAGCGSGSSVPSNAARSEGASEAGKGRLPVVPTFQPSPRATRAALPAGAVVTVAGAPVTARDFERRYRAAARISGASATPAPDPPGYVRCVTAMRAADEAQRARLKRALAQAPKKGGAPKVKLPAKPTGAQLRTRCELRRAAMISAALSQLIQERWTVEQATAAGIKVSEAQVERAIERERRVVGSPARWRALLARTGESEADVRARVRVGLFSRALYAKLGAKTVAARQTSLRSRTVCRAGYVIALCANAPNARGTP